MNVAKIMIVDDHNMFINGLKSLLKNFKELEVVCSFTRADEALQNLSRYPIDVIITDLSLPGMNGIAFIRQIKTTYPHIKTLVLTMHAEAAIIKSVIKENPDGFLLKNTETEELLNAIRTILTGKKFYASEIQEIIIEDMQGSHEGLCSLLPDLSRREKQVLKLIAEEHTTLEIAHRIFLSPNTVETYRQNLLRKLDAKNTAGIVAKAYLLGLL